jgi:hypothetical protein
MNEKGIPKPPEVTNWIPGITLTTEAWRWITHVFNSYPKVQTFHQTLTPTAVTANSESVQTFTVSGLTTVDTVIVNKPTNQSGLDLVHAWVSAANTLSIKFRNESGGDITPTSQAYLITAVRL